ncbi:MAG TPA: ABC transporter ATP-binding protein [Candidatus Saccharimonadales bacterium]|nr:ABC transporter ATP-binding protein [Candidatus Saccharimonadales bacterium]
MNEAIAASGLTVVKNQKTILDNLEFAVRPGSLTGLIGPSGAGKTTLLRSIVGIQRLTTGSLTVLGQPAGQSSLRSRIGYVTQSPSVYPDLTVKQNLDYFGRLIKADSANIEHTINNVQLASQANQLVSTLSGGQRARVSLAVALLGSPDLLVLDEPTVGLDPVLRRDLWQLFNDLANQGRTLIVSSHVMDEAERCHDLLLLRDGRLLWHDSKDELLKSQNVSSVEQAFLKLAGGTDK